ncbi:polysaccharide deacetylase family protein [Bhargavaea cecembensis]|uniref:polysaccharide deacetylase family protein n=1 Tax=Bhargavaea cecembensis TaxID=394098 RepID=UPI00058D6F5F|nr:polysaccharide deacetylase family protein [Bhargavaea cecembensis]
MDNNPFNHQWKDRKKKFRSVVQVGILAILAYFIVHSVFFIKKHETAAIEEENGRGFIALSYFGVDRSGNTKYLSKNELDRQLTILKDQGFETVSQEQVLEFYKNGTPLPKKALFLSFEDGRTDSAIFAQGTLEKLGYKATMFTYADKMDAKDSKFLKPNHLKSMMKSGFWELGTNGYRLKYINVFNGEGGYLGELDEEQIPDKTKVEYYNHYLMDFLKDEFLIPKESHEEMAERITEDYVRMENIYTEKFGEVPGAYAIMHSNSLYNNLNPLVTQVNDQEIKKQFKIHFNRDRKAYNSRYENPMNLNRLQVAPHWPANHLLMQIQKDSQIPVKFISGDEKVAGMWQPVDGVAEHRDGQIILTSVPGKEAALTLQQTIPGNSEITMTLNGNIMGNQTIVLQSKKDHSIVKLSLEKNKMSVIRGEADKEEYIQSSYELSEPEWDRKDYAFSKATNYTYLDTQRGSRIDEDEYPSNLKNNRPIKLKFEGDLLRINLDGQEWTVDTREQGFEEGYWMALSGSSVKQNTTHEQFEDEIYDAIFSDLLIMSGKEPVYTAFPAATERVKQRVSDRVNKVLDFFIDEI